MFLSGSRVSGELVKVLCIIALSIIHGWRNAACRIVSFLVLTLPYEGPSQAYA